MMTMHLQDDEPILPKGVGPFVGHLAAIQGHTDTALLVPTTITDGDARRAREAAQLLSGVLIDGEWEEARMVVDAQQVNDFVTRLASDGSFAATVPYRLRVGTQEVDLGDYVLRLPSARVVGPEAVRGLARSANSPEEGVPIDLAAGDDRRFEMMWSKDRAPLN